MLPLQLFPEESGYENENTNTKMCYKWLQVTQGKTSLCISFGIHILLPVVESTDSNNAALGQ